MGNMHKKNLVNLGHAAVEFCEQTDKQFNRQKYTDDGTSHPSWERSNSSAERMSVRTGCVAVRYVRRRALSCL